MLLGQEVSKLEMPDEVVENYTWQWMWKVYTASHGLILCCMLLQERIQMTTKRQIQANTPSNQWKEVVYANESIWKSSLQKINTFKRDFTLWLLGPNLSFVSKASSICKLNNWRSQQREVSHFHKMIDLLIKQ